MLIYTKTDELAKNFEAAYPEELSARLRWWSKALCMDRASLLRLIGMSARQAADRKGKDLKDILNDPEWQANAQMVEGGLHRLLALFHYDWQALAELIQGHGTAPEEIDPSRVTHRKRERKRLRDKANGEASDLLINRLAKGGPQSLSALVAYLAASQAGAHQAES